MNLSGGERRLNVAVTRARERLVVFGSVRADQLDLSRTGAIGVRHLKQFLAFAEHGARSFATATQGPLGDHESPFEVQVAERLRQLGWNVHPQVGVSGFRIDLGIVDPDAPCSYLAGVECDGATYHRGATARDRDRLRQAVLETLGWNTLRVWSTDWWTKAAREAERLDGALRERLLAAQAKRAARDQELAGHTVFTEQAAGEPAIDIAEPAMGDLDDRSPSPDSEPVAAAAGAVPLRFYEPSYRDSLAAIVARVLTEQGPMREDRLVHAVARLHGFKRSGREIRDRVMSVIPETSGTTVEDAGSFVWPPGMDPAAWDRFRAPRPGLTADPMEMPLAELTVLARECLTRGLSEEAALLRMRDACGLQRLRETARARCLAALQEAQR